VDFDIGSWLHAGQVALDLRGNNFGKIMARDPRTYLPTQIELVHPDTVQVTVDRDGSVGYKFAGKPVDGFDVWHERQNETPGSVVGQSPIAAAARALGITLAAEDYGGSVLLGRAHPVRVAVLRCADRRGRGEDRQTPGAGHPAGPRTPRPRRELEIQQLAVNPAEAMFLEVMRYGREEVALLFDVPGEMINAPAQGSSVTYANREQRAQDLLAFRLGPAIARRERALSRLTVRGQYVKLNTAALLRTDLASRMKAYDQGLKIGVYAHDEARALEDLPPLTAEQIATLKDFGLLGAKTTPAGDGEPAATTGTPLGANA
jgi:HK97 family phage portal protein